MSSSRSETKWWHVAIFILFLPILLLLLAVAGSLFLVKSVCLHVCIWSRWCSRGRDILFVYSDSPTWHDYIEKHILPHLGERAVVLNWSDRRGWRASLARAAFHHFGGNREFNPMAVVFRPFRRTRTFRFWQPFRKWKHGNPQPLVVMESEFFASIGIQRNGPHPCEDSSSSSCSVRE